MMASVTCKDLEGSWQCNMFTIYEPRGLRGKSQNLTGENESFDDKKIALKHKLEFEPSMSSNS